MTSLLLSKQRQKRVDKEPHDQKYGRTLHRDTKTLSLFSLDRIYTVAKQYNKQYERGKLFSLNLEVVRIRETKVT